MTFLHTEFSHLSGEELIQHVASNPNATPMERELAAHLADAFDEIDEYEANDIDLIKAIQPAIRRTN